jgi:hypothetical protein
MFATYALHHSRHHFVVPDLKLPFVRVFPHFPLPLAPWPARDGVVARLRGVGIEVVEEGASIDAS